MRQIRLATAIVLMAFTVQHFSNLMLGNISLSAMEAGRYAQTLVWSNRVGGTLLYCSLLVHGALGVYSIYSRRYFRIGFAESAQGLLGLAIPFLLASHFVATRLGRALYGLQANYPELTYVFWMGSPAEGVEQTALALIVWLHACLGLRRALNLPPASTATRPALLVAAVLIPTLAALGAWQASREMRSAVDDPAWRAANLGPDRVASVDQARALGRCLAGLELGLVAIVGGAVIARLARRRFELRGGGVHVSFGERRVRIPRGASVLEAALRHGVPIAHVCGGRARCSTCRVRVLGDAGALPEPGEIERAVLARIHARPGLRLACQLRPTTDIAVVPLLSPFVGPEAGRSARPSQFGSEMFLTSMFVDMRGSTDLAERRLPFDTVFIVNRFLQAVSGAAIASGGAPNTILGDGILILFGLETGPSKAAQQAITCSWRIAEAIESLNVTLAHDLTHPIRFGLGAHCGPAIVGEIGYGRHAAFTAIGDSVNVAARLQEISKSLACEAVVSDAVFATAGWTLEDPAVTEVSARGRAERLKVRCVASARALKSAGQTV